MESKESKPPPPSPQPLLLRQLIRFDTALSLQLHNLTQPIIPRFLLKTLEISGDGRLFFPIILSLLLSPLSSTTVTTLRPFLVNLLLGALLDLVVIGLIKHLVRRPRPVYNKNMFLTFSVDHWSFPSGHSSRVFLIASFLYFTSDFIEKVMTESRSDSAFLAQFSSRWISSLFSDEVKATSYVVSIVSLWAGLTSISRVLLGRHFVFDVIAGACLGVLEAFFVFRFFNYENLSSTLQWESGHSTFIMT